MMSRLMSDEQPLRHVSQKCKRSTLLIAVMGVLYSHNKPPGFATFAVVGKGVKSPQPLLL